MTDQPKQPNCPQCGKPIERPVGCKITFRNYNRHTRRQYVDTKSMDFCSKQCGSHYQMGCEG